MPIPAIMPRFSPGLPVTIDAGNTAFPAANLVADSYNSKWGTDSASPSFPVWGAINVSSYNGTVTLKNVIMHVDFNQNGNYTSSFGVGADMSTTGSDWKVRGHTNLNGGVPPVDGDAGWVDIVTISGSTFAQRLHMLKDCRSYNWIEIRFTAQNGTNGIKVKIELFDASGGVPDTWLIFGDSTTSEGAADLDAVSGVEWASGPIQRKVFSKAGRFPLVMAAGSGGQNMQFLKNNIVGLVAPNIDCQCFGIDYGVNDANGGTLSGAEVTTWHDNLLFVVDYLLSLNKIVLLSYVQYQNVGGNSGPANARTLNGQVDSIIAARPAVIQRPVDLYTAFANHPTLLRTDNLHPGFDDGTGGGPMGYNAWQQEWVTVMIAAVYSGNAVPMISGGSMVVM